MRESIFTLLFLIAATSTLFSQKKTEDFRLSLPERKIDGALYKTIRYIDSRRDTSNMGIVQLGAFNRKARVKPETPFEVQLKAAMDALAGADAGEGEIIFQLRQLLFAEVIGSFSEKGYCFLRAATYEKSGEHYLPLKAIDTVVLIKAMDVTRALFRNGSQTVNDFIAQSLVSRSVSQSGYTWSEVIKLDSIEKSKTALYTATKYKDGLYRTYASLRDQQPDAAITATIKDAELSVKAADETGKLKKLKPKEVYAVVYEGQPYIATEYGYYRLTKEGDDFFFTGKAKVNAKAGDMIAAGMFFGVIGSLIASDASSTFDMMLDHIDGGFIHLREVEVAAQ